MTIHEARQAIIKSIKTIYDDQEAKNIAGLLLEWLTKLNRTELVLRKNENITDEQEKLLYQSVGRLKNSEPVQYITHEAWFAGMKFYVDQFVLIPRPETEELVEWVAMEIKDQSQATQVQKMGGNRILDVGTGSGCIAISLKKKFPTIEVWACDVSDEALNVARLNADALNATIDFLGLDFLDREQRKQLPNFDIIVSNPPYVPAKERNEMKKNVEGYEPSTALFVPNEAPLVFYDAIIEFARENLTERGKIFVEIHENFSEQVIHLFHEKGFKKTNLKKDLQGKNRMIEACRP